MSGSEAILDTNAFIALTNGDKSIALLLARLARPALTLFTLAELLYGARNSGRVELNLEGVRKRTRGFHLLVPDSEPAECYAQVFAGLRRKGRPIPSNDVWIAAIALRHKLPLLTRDAHFRVVDGPDVLLWRSGDALALAPLFPLAPNRRAGAEGSLSLARLEQPPGAARGNTGARPGLPRSG